MTPPVLNQSSISTVWHKVWLWIHMFWLKYSHDTHFIMSRPPWQFKPYCSFFKKKDNYNMKRAKVQFLCWSYKYSIFICQLYKYIINTFLQNLWYLVCLLYGESYFDGLLQGHPWFLEICSNCQQSALNCVFWQHLKPPSHLKPLFKCLVNGV